LLPLSSLLPLRRVVVVSATSSSSSPLLTRVLFGPDRPRWVVPVVCCGLGAVSCLRIVTTGDELLVERFGKFHRKLEAGWHFLVPIAESVSFDVTVRERVLDVPPQQCYTKDNAPVEADAVVYAKVRDAVAARYAVQDVDGAILNLCLTNLREEVGKLTLDESFSSRERINRELLRDLNEVCLGWGIEITRVELQNLRPSPAIQEAMELQMAAERRKRAAILESEGEKLTMVNEAEGRATAAIRNAEASHRATILAAEAEASRQRIEAEGLRRAIETVAEGISSSSSAGGRNDDGEGPPPSGEAVEAAVQFLTAVRYLETQASVARSDNSKVVMLPSKDSLPMMTYGGLKFLLD